MADRILTEQGGNDVPPTPKKRRYRKNDAERAFVSAAIAAGWFVTKRGWPDFIMSRRGEVAFVEVKRGNSPLRREQMKVAKLLAAAGFKVFKWTPAAGFVRLRA